MVWALFLMPDFRSTTIDELIKAKVLEVGDGYRTRADQLDRDGLPILRVGDIGAGRLHPATGDRVALAYRKAMGRKTSRSGDVIITTKGTVGRTARVPADFAEHVYSPQVCFLRVLDAEVVDPLWLHYWAKSPEFQDQLRTFSGQTDMAPYLSLSDLRRFVVSLPEPREQAAVARALAAFDDVIELHHRTSEAAQELARNLGHRLLASAAGRPEVKLPELADIVKGYSYTSAELGQGDAWLVNLKNIGRGGHFASRGFKRIRPLKRKAAQVIHDGDVVVAQTDLTQDREVIARPVRVRRGTLTGELVASLDLAIVRPKAPYSRELLYAVLDSADFRLHALGYCNGTTVLHMGARALPDYVVPLPDVASMEQFTAEVTPLWDTAHVSAVAASRITAVADEVLPLLFSGALSAAEVEAGAA